MDTNRFPLSLPRQKPKGWLFASERTTTKTEQKIRNGTDRSLNTGDDVVPGSASKYLVTNAETRANITTARTRLTRGKRSPGPGFSPECHLPDGTKKDGSFNMKLTSQKAC